MSDLGFEILSHDQGPPFRTRSVFAGYEAYSTGTHSVLISPDVRAGLTTSAEQALPRETGGVLFGRILQDNLGTYTLVVGMVGAPREAGGYGEVQLSAELTSRLKDEGARQHPTCDPVGWWHSHPSPSQYSGTDRRNQSLWTDPRHVGLLAFARARDEWGLVYVGPDSQLAHPLGTAGQPPQRQVQPEPKIPWQKGIRKRSAEVSRWPRRHSDRPVLSRIVAVLVLVLTAIIISVLCGYLNLVRLIDHRMPADSRPRLTWSCPLSRDLTEYRCSATTDSSASVEWRVDGLSFPGTSVAVPRPVPGMATSVEIWLTDGGNRYKVESFSLAGPDLESVDPNAPPSDRGGR